MAFSPLRKLLPACALIVLAGLPLALLTLGGGRAGRAPGGYASVDTAVGKRFVRPEAAAGAHSQRQPRRSRHERERAARVRDGRCSAPRTRASTPCCERGRPSRRARPDERSPPPARRRGRSTPPTSAAGRRRSRSSGDGGARRRPAHRQGHVVLVSEEPDVRHGGDGPASPNTAQAWLWDPATGQQHAHGPAAVARPRGRRAEARQHLVRRPVLHR